MTRTQPPDPAPPTTDGVEVRPPGPADEAAWSRQGREAFGEPGPGGAGAPPAADGPGRHPWGLFVDGTLVARAVDREFDSWFGGRTVPTCGIGSGSVDLEHRGDGRLTPLMTALLDGARRRGAAVATLFPSAPRIYRRFGFELVTHLDTVDVPTGVLGTVPAPDAVRTRRAGPEDVEALRECHDAWASAQDGPLTRRGPSFPETPEQHLASYSGVTLAVDGQDRVLGYAAWRRGSGYDALSRLDVPDLVARDVRGTAALLHALGTFAPVAPMTRLRTSGEDPARTLLPTGQWHPVDRDDYMLRVLDPAAALGARGYPGHLAADLVLELADGLFDDLDGCWRLRVEGGRATCERTRLEPTLRFTSRGLAVGFAGARSLANLRMTGLVEGDTADDEVWDALFRGRETHVRDYF